MSSNSKETESCSRSERRIVTLGIAGTRTRGREDETMIEDPQRVVPGRAAIQGLQVLESCGFTWIFDSATRLFRRIPRDARVSLGVPMAWTPYVRLEIDESRSCFVVVLHEAGTRILRAWLHADPCDRCCPEWEPLGDSKSRIVWWKERLRVVDRRIGRRHPLRPFGGWLGAEGSQ